MAKITRRSFLKTVVVSAGAVSVAPSLLACGGPSRPAEEVFPQSIASGDPRADSIVLWTRAVDDESMDTSVRLELATDEGFGSRVELSGLATLTATGSHDHCLRLKVTGLEAGTTYYYRFEANDARSHTGRFRTAPAPDADVAQRFAVLSCQDYVGRYYNALLRLLDAEHDDLDFVVHLGDYVYETTGDPGFMMGSDERAMRFRAPEEAIPFDDGAFHAARSVGNYRDLYRTIRSDPTLQRLHERFAFVCTWDDHEFSDDSHGATATYTDGVLDETDADRKVAAEQAYFEYMPLARDGEAPPGGESGALDVGPLYPDNRLYRSFRFGAHLTLAVTDYRSFRPDHPTPEDAFPGAVVLDEAAVMATLARQEADGELETDAATAFTMGGFRTYVDLGGRPDHAAALELLLTAGYVADGVPADRAAQLAARYAQGNVDAAILQATIDAGRASLPSALMGVSDIDPEDASLSRGLPYALLGKTGLTGQLGARYLTVLRTYELAAAHRHRVLGELEADDVLGATQEAWLRETLSTSDATWNVVGNSVCNTSLVLDLRPFAGGLPEALPPERVYLNLDHWDGFPERRRVLMREVYAPASAVLLAGDIHAAYATDFGLDADGKRVIELTTPGVSSGSFKELLFRTGNAVPSIRDSGLLEPVLESLDIFMQTAFEPLKIARSDVNGVMTVRVDGSELRVDWHLLPEDVVRESYYDRPAELEPHFTTITQVVAKEGGTNGPLPGLDV